MNSPSSDTGAPSQKHVERPHNLFILKTVRVPSRGGPDYIAEYGGSRGSRTSNGDHLPTTPGMMLEDNDTLTNKNHTASSKLMKSNWLEGMPLDVLTLECSLDGLRFVRQSSIDV